MSDSEVQRPDLAPDEVTVGRLADEGYIVPQRGHVVMHPDGRLAFVRPDGTYQVWHQLEDAMRSLGRPARPAVEYGSDGNRIVAK